MNIDTETIRIRTYRDEAVHLLPCTIVHPNDNNLSRISDPEHVC
jgi:hypothetical protein